MTDATFDLQNIADAVIQRSYMNIYHLSTE